MCFFRIQRSTPGSTSHARPLSRNDVVDKCQLQTFQANRAIKLSCDRPLRLHNAGSSAVKCFRRPWKFRQSSMEHSSEDAIFGIAIQEISIEPPLPLAVLRTWRLDSYECPQPDITSIVLSVHEPVHAQTNQARRQRKDSSFPCSQSKP
jgi:hypothetical protein